jgi:hypothetical protein
MHQQFILRRIFEFVHAVGKGGEVSVISGDGGADVLYLGAGKVAAIHARIVAGMAPDGNLFDGAVS